MPPKRQSPVVNPSSQPNDLGKKPTNPTAVVHPVKHKLVAKAERLGFCKFKAKGRCYVEGTLLEDADQEISLSPAGSYRQRSSRNLELIEGTIPTMAEDAPARPHKNAPSAEKKAFAEYEVSFVESLEDGDPIVGVAPGKLKLISQ